MGETSRQGFEVGGTRNRRGQEGVVRGLENVPGAIFGSVASCVSALRVSARAFPVVVGVAISYFDNCRRSA